MFGRSQNNNFIESTIWLTCLVHLIWISFAFGPSKIDKIGRVTVYNFEQFKIMEQQAQKSYNTYLSMPNTRIITMFLKNMAKTSKALQIVRLNGSRGLYELILLTQPNNYNNRLVIIKQSPEEYVWVNKNLYLNGLDNQTVLYYAQLSDVNIVTEGQQSQINSIVSIFNDQSQCLQKNCRFYRIQTTLSEIAKLNKLEEQDSKRGNLHLFITVSSLREAQILSKQLSLLNKNYKIELVLQLKVQVPYDLFILSSQSNKQNLMPNQINQRKFQIRSNLKIYSIFLKISEKKSILQFNQVNRLIKQQHQYQFLNEGVYYLTETDDFFKK